MNADIFSVVFCFLCLIYASWMDIKERRVTNWLWLLCITVGIPFATYNILIFGIPFLIRFIFSLLFTSVLSYLLFKFHLFGGADAKSLICISVLIPAHPGFDILFYHFPIYSSFVEHFPFALTTLLNAAIIALVVPLSLFFYNIFLHREELRGNLGLAFIGYKLHVDKLTGVKNKHIRLVHLYKEEEKGEGDLRRKFFFGGVEIDDGVVEMLRNYLARGKIDEEVWVTPELPFMLLITAGFFISILYGNLIFHILSFLLSSHL